jgi:hypothetical protein
VITLQPLRFPRPVPIPIWTDDYADLPERIRRDGRFDTEDVWLSHSGDSWGAFCGRHGTYEFALDWRELKERDRAAKARAESRYGERIRQQQERWEVARREREQAKQAEADREWQQIEKAKAHWSQRKPAYATEPYHIVNIGKTGKIDGVELLGGKSYWLPHSIHQRLLAYVKTHNLGTVT